MADGRESLELSLPSTTSAIPGRTAWLMRFSTNSQHSTSNANRRAHDRFPHLPTIHGIDSSQSFSRRLQRRRLPRPTTLRGRVASNASTRLRKHKARRQRGSCKTTTQKVRESRQSSLHPRQSADKQLVFRILADAATKRFHAYKLYLQAQAAIRWASYRQKILQGQRPHAGHAQALAQLQANLRQELLSLSDQRVAALLRHADLQERKWIAEDPSVDEMVRWRMM